MKKIFVLIVALVAMWQGAFCQIDLEIVWQKNIFPTQINFAKFSADGNYIYCAVGNNIHKMDAKTGEFVSVFDNTGLIHGIYELDITSNGEYLITTNSQGGASIWDTKSEKIKYRILPDSNTKDKSSWIECSSISPDGNYALLGQITLSGMPPNREDCVLIIYDIEQGKEVNRLVLQERPTKIQISHDGKYFVTGSVYQNQLTKKWHDKLILWETGTWKQAAILEDKEETDNNPGYRMIKFSKDDKYLGIISQIYNGPYIYNLITNKIIKTSEGKACFDIDFLPDTLSSIIQTDSLYLYNINGFKLVKSYNTEDFGGRLIESCYDVYKNINVFSLGGKCTQCLSLLKVKFNSIQDIEKLSKNVNIYVNNGIIIIELLEIRLPSLNIFITDVLGRTLYNEKIESTSISNKLSLDVALPSGTYICKVKAGEAEYSTKIEIVR